MKCKDCEKYWTTATEGYGVCTLPDSYRATTTDTDCIYLNFDKFTCKDCINFGDYSCLTVDEEDNTCMFFEHKDETTIYNIWLNWILCGEDIEKQVNYMLQQFMDSKIYKFIQEHKGENECGE